MTPSTCSGGTDHEACAWALEPCAGCAAITADARRDFAAAVAAGEMDDRGYEPGDRQFRQDTLF